jgi:hypothetical protein
LAKEDHAGPLGSEIEGANKAAKRKADAPFHMPGLRPWMIEYGAILRRLNTGARRVRRKPRVRTRNHPFLGNPFRLGRYQIEARSGLCSRTGRTKAEPGGLGNGFNVPRGRTESSPSASPAGVMRYLAPAPASDRLSIQPFSTVPATVCLPAGCSFADGSPGGALVRNGLDR